MVNIYFCGAIRGGRTLASTYQEIIGLLQMHGKVFTEHVGDEGEVSSRDMGLSDNQIHDRDLQWIRESDVVIAEVTVPSLGVGYEIGRAIEFGLPVMCLYNSNSGKKLSAMIAGSEGVMIHYYTDTRSLAPIVSEFIRQHAPHRTSGSS